MYRGSLLERHSQCICDTAIMLPRRSISETNSWFLFGLLVIPTDLAFADWCCVILHSCKLYIIQDINHFGASSLLGSILGAFVSTFYLVGQPLIGLCHEWLDRITSENIDHFDVSLCPLQKKKTRREDTLRTRQRSVQHREVLTILQARATTWSSRLLSHNSSMRNMCVTNERSNPSLPSLERSIQKQSLFIVNFASSCFRYEPQYSATSSNAGCCKVSDGPERVYN